MLLLTCCSSHCLHLQCTNCTVTVADIQMATVIVAFGTTDLLPPQKKCPFHMWDPGSIYYFAMCTWETKEPSIRRSPDPTCRVHIANSKTDVLKAVWKVSKLASHGWQRGYCSRWQALNRWWNVCKSQKKHEAGAGRLWCRSKCPWQLMMMHDNSQIAQHAVWTAL